MAFKPAQRKNSKLRLAMSAPSGGGKTFTALTIAKMLAELFGLAKVPALLDSERSSAEKYARKPNTPEGPGNWDFDHDNLDEKYPQEYIAKISEAAQGGYELLILDSFSHAWIAALEMIDRTGGWSKGGKTVSPLYARMLDAIMNYPGHVIATIRSKTAHEFEKDDKGKLTVRKMGLAPVARDGTEYEFDIWLDFSIEGTATVTKSRCPSVPPGTIYDRADIPKLVVRLKDWLDEGAPLSAVEDFSRQIKFASSDAEVTTIVKGITAAIAGGTMSKEEAATLKPAIIAKKNEIATAGEAA